MTVAVNRRSIMSLFSDPACPESHRVRMVLAEKEVVVEIVNVKQNKLSDELLELNPYGFVPTLVDRDLVLYDGYIIMEYLDERFPHPPLLPVDPVFRAQCRLALYHIKHDWYQAMHTIESGDGEQAAAAREKLNAEIQTITPIVERMPFFLNQEMTLVDCSIAPVLWRLPYLGIALNEQPKPIMKYAQRLFGMHSFKASLSAVEKEMHS